MSELNKRSTFAQIEENRIYGLRAQLFSKEACDGMPRRTHLSDNAVLENLFEPVRKAAPKFFLDRNIQGHGSNVWDSSITSSQVACVNCWYPFVDRPDLLTKVLYDVLGDVDEVLPITDETELDCGVQPYLTFEWIDRGNRLKEPGRPVRGKYVTNVDVLFRYKSTKGSIKLVLTEWKYRECYAKGSVQFSDKGTDRLAIYFQHFGTDSCQIQLADSLSPVDLMYHPFDQLMRLQLLSSLLKRDSVMEADETIVLCISPRANIELSKQVYSPKLKEFFGGEATVYDIWGALTVKDSFFHFALEDLVAVLIAHSPNLEYSDYIGLRYRGIADRMLEVDC